MKHNNVIQSVSNQSLTLWSPLNSEACSPGIGQLQLQPLKERAFISLCADTTFESCNKDNLDFIVFNFLIVNTILFSAKKQHLFNTTKVCAWIISTDL